MQIVVQALNIGVSAHMLSTLADGGWPLDRLDELLISRFFDCWACLINCFIEHPRGLILIDTGWNKANRDHQLWMEKRSFKDVWAGWQ